MPPRITSAFIPGAGLGKRLQPLTSLRPKPLVPFLQRPLITYALDHVIALGVQNIVINTHHLPDAWSHIFPTSSYQKIPLHFTHEPILLETGGGIRNARRLLGEQTFLVHNGDIFSTAPLQPLIERHFADGNLATLVLRSFGGPLQVQFNSHTRLIEDIGSRIGNSQSPSYLFTGMALYEPDIFHYIPDGEIISIIPILIELIKSGARIGAIVIDEGYWCDLGTPVHYLNAHQTVLSCLQRPAWLVDPSWPTPIHPDAGMAQNVSLEGCCVIGAGTRIETSAQLRDTIVWPGAKILPGTHLDRCIVCGTEPVSGAHTGKILGIPGVEASIDLPSPAN